MNKENLKPLTDEQSKIAGDNIALIYWCIGKSGYAGKIRDMDGLLSDLQMVFCKVVRSHVAERGTLATYAVASMLPFIRRFARNEAAARRRTRSLTPYQRSSDYGPNPLCTEDPQGDSDEADLVKRFRGMLARMPYPERFAMTLCANDEPVGSMAPLFGFTRQRAHQIFHQGVRRMKVWLESAERTKIRVESVRVPGRRAEPVSREDCLKARRDLAKKRYLSRRATGMCVAGCGRDSIKGRSLCLKCREKIRVKKRASTC